MIGIYKLIWKNSQYIYIGQSRDIKRRKRNHLSKLASNKHYNVKLQRIFNKYGMPDFIIIENCEVLQLTEREQYWIDFYNDEFLCNYHKIANKHYPRTTNEETRQKLRLANLGTKKSKETKHKISEAKKYLTGCQRINIILGQLGKTNSSESNEKRRVFMLNVSNEYRENMRIVKTGTYTGVKNHASKLVLNLETGVYYDTLKDASLTISHINYAYLKTMVAGSNRNKTQFIYA